jgi:hypothetical protein
MMPFFNATYSFCDRILIAALDEEISVPGDLLQGSGTSWPIGSVNSSLCLGASNLADLEFRGRARLYVVSKTDILLLPKERRLPSQSVEFKQRIPRLPRFLLPKATALRRMS